MSPVCGFVTILLPDNSRTDKKVATDFDVADFGAAAA
jgi:hypothetical protein